VTCWVSLDLGSLTLRSEFFAKSLAHDGTLERCVSLVPKVHTLLSFALNLPKIQFVSYASC
jgi:hypothetical protein